jgi:hypothetical protein
MEINIQVNETMTERALIFNEMNHQLVADQGCSTQP